MRLHVASIRRFTEKQCRKHRRRYAGRVEQLIRRMSAEELQQHATVLASMRERGRTGFRSSSCNFSRQSAWWLLELCERDAGIV